MNNHFPQTRAELKRLGYSEAQIHAEIQNRIDRYMDTSNQNIDRLNNQYNENERARATQLITLATLLITITGLFISQADIFGQLNGRHKLLILLVFIALLASIFYGVRGYFENADFFLRWRRILDKSSREIAADMQSGALARVDDMYTKEKEMLTKHSDITRDLAVPQLAAVLAGGGLFVLLLVALMYDLPLIK